MNKRGSIGIIVIVILIIVIILFGSIRFAKLRNRDSNGDGFPKPPTSPTDLESKINDTQVIDNETVVNDSITNQSIVNESITNETITNQSSGNESNQTQVIPETMILGIEMTKVIPELDKAKTINIKAIRTPLRWGEIEPENDNFNFSKFDEIVDEAYESDLKLVFTVRALSSWATVEPPSEQGGYLSSSMPSDMSEWNEFLGAVVNRYKNRDVDISYEIENEVNADAFWKGTIDDYVLLLEQSYTIIKSIDPDIIVLASSLACGITKDIPSAGYDQFRASYQADLEKIINSDSFDVLSVHNYYFPDHEANGITFQGYLELTNEVMDYNSVSKPIWITESGYVSTTTSVGSRTDYGSLENQANWLEQAYTYADEQGIERIFWIILEDRDEPYFGSMGLLSNDGSKRASGEAFEELAG